jgi:ABC-type Mn2+/Zn2+ transport system permease subunit
MSAELRLFGAVLAACSLVALACGLLSVHVVARRLVTVGLALPQMAALGIALSILVAGAEAEHADALQHDAMALAMQMVGAALLAWGARGRSLGQDAVAGVLFAAAAALTVLVMLHTSLGMDEVKNLVDGNMLAVHGSDLARLACVLVPVVLLHALGGRRLLFCSFDRETAATLGVRTGAWEIAFYASLAVTIAAGVHAVGTLFVFGFLVLPGAAGIALGRSATGVFVTSAVVAVVGAAAGFHLCYVWDTPPGPTCVAAALALFGVCAGVGALRGRAAAAA